jgi:hypothetical protein
VNIDNNLSLDKSWTYCRLLVQIQQFSYMTPKHVLTLPHLIESPGTLQMWKIYLTILQIVQLYNFSYLRYAYAIFYIYIKIFSNRLLGFKTITIHGKYKASHRNNVFLAVLWFEFKDLCLPGRQVCYHGSHTSMTHKRNLKIFNICSVWNKTQKLMHTRQTLHYQEEIFEFRIWIGSCLVNNKEIEIHSEQG